MQSAGLFKASPASGKTPLFGSSSSRPVLPIIARPNIVDRDVSVMAKKKGIRLIVTLECTEARKADASPSRYVTQKNRKNTPDRLELMKYNPFLKRHTLHKEIK